MKKLLFLILLISSIGFAQRNPTTYETTVSTTQDTIDVGSVDSYTVTVWNISTTSTDSIFIYTPKTTNSFNEVSIPIAYQKPITFDMYSDKFIVVSNNTAVPIKYWTGNMGSPAVNININGFVASDSVTALRTSIDALTDTVNVIKAQSIDATNFSEGDVPELQSGEFKRYSLDTLIKKVDTVYNKVNYKSYVALLTQGLADATSGSLIVGHVYNIVTLQAGDDFSNVGYVSQGVDFVATGTTPTDWTHSTRVLDKTVSAPIPTVLYNDLGITISYSYEGIGVYEATLSSPIDLSKATLNFGSSYTNDGYTYVLFNVLFTSSTTIIISTYTESNSANDLLTNTSIEIRVYE